MKDSTTALMREKSVGDGEWEIPEPLKLYHGIKKQFSFNKKRLCGHGHRDMLMGKIIWKQRKDNLLESREKPRTDLSLPGIGQADFSLLASDSINLYITRLLSCGTSVWQP